MVIIEEHFNFFILLACLLAYSVNEVKKTKRKHYQKKKNSLTTYIPK